MENPSGRSAVKVVAVFVVVALVAVVGFASYASTMLKHEPSFPPIESSTSTTRSRQAASETSSYTQSTSSSPSATASSGGLTITNMFGDVAAPGIQSPYSNSSSIADGTTLKGSPGKTYDILVEAIYQDCNNGCPAEITSVTSSTPGFVVVGTAPSLPISFENCGFLCVDGMTSVSSEGGVQAAVTVKVTAPSTPYTGTLTLVAHTK